MAELRVFVSSTCYDLSLLRSQLRTFIKTMGYEPIMSDYEDGLYDAMLALEAGDDIKTLQEHLGHATAAFTLSVYGHVSELMHRRSAAHMDRVIQSFTKEAV